MGRHHNRKYYHGDYTEEIDKVFTYTGKMKINYTLSDSETKIIYKRRQHKRGRKRPCGKKIKKKKAPKCKAPKCTTTNARVIREKYGGCHRYKLNSNDCQIWILTYQDVKLKLPKLHHNNTTVMTFTVYVKDCIEPDVTVYACQHDKINECKKFILPCRTSRVTFTSYGCEWMASSQRVA